MVTDNLDAVDADREVSALSTAHATDMSFRDASIWMRDWLAQHGEFDVTRALSQVFDDLNRSRGDAQRQLAILEPPPVATGDERYDALIAGWAETTAIDLGLPVPSWVRRAPVLDTVWYVSRYLKSEADRDTPDPLRRRGVRTGRVDLQRLSAR